MAHITLNLDADLVHRAETLAAERGTTVDAFIEEAVREHLKDDELTLPAFGDPNGKPKIDILDRDQLEEIEGRDGLPDDWP